MGGLDTNDFVRNLDNAPIVGGSYFSADLSDGRNTGAQAWAIRSNGTRLPEPGTVGLLMLSLLGAVAVTKRRRG